MVIRYIVFGFFFLLLYLLFFPVKVDPAVWNPPPSPGWEGIYASNEELKRVEVLFPECHECEDVAIDSAGNLYAGSVDGKIFVYNLKTGTHRVVAETEGRPLGIHLDKDNYLILADAGNALVSISPEGTTVPLCDTFPGVDLKIIDDVDMDSAETIYFSNASDRFYFEKYKHDLVEHRPNGQLFAYYPATQEYQMLMDSLYFANGVALDHNEDFVLVAETGAYRVSRYWLKGPKAGTSDIFIDKLPGFPDGISRGKDGIFWLTLVSPRKASLDAIMDKPFIRKILVRLPPALQPKPGKRSAVLGLNREGKVVHNFQDPEGTFGQITNAQQFGDSLYLGSLGEQGIGVFKLP